MSKKREFRSFVKRNEALLMRFYEMLQDPNTHMRTIADDLDEFGIEYCVIGGLALRIHNFSRYTKDIDILVSKEGYKKLYEKLLGRIYARRPGSHRNLYYVPGPGTRVPVDIFVEGGRKGKMVFPHPAKVGIKIGGVWYLDYHSLLRFKLNSERGQDVADATRLLEMNPERMRELPPDVE